MHTPMEFFHFFTFQDGGMASTFTQSFPIKEQTEQKVKIGETLQGPGTIGLDPQW